MIPYRKALDILLAAVQVMPAEKVRIESAHGRVLRREVHADRPFPPFDRVMMDGYALRVADLSRGNSFRVAGSAPAGKPQAVLPEEAEACVEIMTGAPLPMGADCIVPVEQTSRTKGDGMIVAPSFEPKAGLFIHRAGSDAAEGEVLLEPGILLGSREIGVAASCGVAMLEVSKLPRIAIIPTGDELVPVEETPAPHQIRQSNGHAIRCALQSAGFSPVLADTLSDDARAENLRVHLESSDWLIITGAVSKGSRDFIPMLLDSLGCRRLFHGVAQRPGKPAGCWLGPVGQVIMALPGNPVSALTGLHAFVLPALDKALGMTPRPQRMVVPHCRVNALDGMTLHLPVTLGEDGHTHAAPPGNSGDFIGLLRSDGFITMPPRGETALAFPFTSWL
jgi:molybdopterin molybdotransferase